ncbi:MAG TPA: hypothetical protein VF601_03525 [Beijerinckiaceae bacterium]|jgi:hypothetical protein
MPRRVRVLPLAFLAAALSGSALAQDSARGAGPEERGVSRSWADEVRSAIGSGRNGKGAGQGANEAPVRSDMQTGSTGRGAAPGKPEKR